MLLKGLRIHLLSIGSYLFVTVDYKIFPKNIWLALDRFQNFQATSLQIANKFARFQIKLYTHPQCCVKHPTHNTKQHCYLLVFYTSQSV